MQIGNMEYMVMLLEMFLENLRKNDRDSKV